MSTDYDYTRDDEQSNLNEDYAITTYTPGPQTADQIERESGRRDIPPGDHTLVVQAVYINPPQSYMVTVGGQVMSYLSRGMSVQFCLASDERARIRDFFMLPPENPAEHRAYHEGVAYKKGEPPSDKPQQGGFASRKMTHFLDRLGVTDPSGSLLLQFARPSSWKGRAVAATVDRGKGEYKNAKGETRPRDNQVRLFSYNRADAARTNARLDAAQSGRRPSPSPAREPVGAAAGYARTAEEAGYDDV